MDEVWGPGQGSHQLCTSCTEGVPSTRSGSRLISFMMFARRTGSSCRRKVNEVFSQALLDPGGREGEKEVSAQSCQPSEPQDRHLQGQVASTLHFLKVQRSDGGTEQAALPRPCRVLTSPPRRLTHWGTASSPHPQLNPAFLQEQGADPLPGPPGASCLWPKLSHCFSFFPSYQTLTSG